MVAGGPRQAQERNAQELVSDKGLGEVCRRDPWEDKENKKNKEKKEKEKEEEGWEGIERALIGCIEWYSVQ